MLMSFRQALRVYVAAVPLGLKSGTGQRTSEGS